MKVYSNLDNFRTENPVVTIGTFDGLHKGHKKIISKLKNISGKINGESVIFTFYPHPRKVIFPEQKIKLLTTIEEKIELAEKAGVENMVICHFTHQFAQMTSEEFIKKILIDKIGIKFLVVGFNHQFGKDRKGNYENLKTKSEQYGFDIEKVEALEIDDIRISSSRIRQLITSGDITTANKYLGYHYFLNGTVIEGQKIGRKIGFPTANIRVHDPDKLIPKQGVYAVRVKIFGKMYNGMLNIGTKPTFNNINEKTIEVNIFDFQTNIYNREIRVEFIGRLRDEIKFASENELRQRLEKDRQESIFMLEKFS